MSSYPHGVARGKSTCSPERTLAEHELDAPRPEGQWENVPVRCSVHDCATRGDPKHMQSFYMQSFEGEQ